jgi:two-component system, LytTR family, sensor kinase
MPILVARAGGVPGCATFTMTSSEAAALASRKCRVRWGLVWAWSFAVWLTVWGLFSLQRYVYLHGRGKEVPAGEPTAMLLEWLLWAVFTPGLLAYCWQRPVTRATWKQSLPWQIAGALVGPALFLIPFHAMRYLMSEATGAPDLYREMTPSLFFWLWVAAISTYADIALVAHAFHFAQTSRDERDRTTKLEARLAQAQLEVLRLQLHPHFLFNTLHTISALMHKDLRAADRMLALLGELLRDSFDRLGAQEVSLKQELGFLERYLEIERTRFRDRLTVTMDIDPATLDAEVPNLLLQPLVENAIRHGLTQRSGAGRLDIRAEHRENRLCLRIQDDGPGLAEGSLVAIRGGVGLANTQARLQQLYGAAYRLDLRNRETGGLEVAIDIPFKLCPAPVMGTVAPGTSAARVPPLSPLAAQPAASTSR